MEVGQIISTFDGDPEAYDFKQQKKNYEAIKAILGEFNMKFTKIRAVTYAAERSYIARYDGKDKLTTLTTFKVIVGPEDDPIFIWHKYEGFTAGGGRNAVRFAEQEIKLSDFLGQQNALLNAYLEKPQSKAYKKKQAKPMALTVDF
jgi:hypothetical protein